MKRHAHTWVPVADCPEMADGKYVVRGPSVPAQLRLVSKGAHAGWVTHVLNPHLGPIPAYESAGAEVLL